MCQYAQATGLIPCRLTHLQAVCDPTNILHQPNLSVIPWIGLADLSISLSEAWQVCIAGERRPMKVLLIAMAVFAVSGASAGLLGIGGALIFNPYLLQLGMDPRVSLTTSRLA